MKKLLITLTILLLTLGSFAVAKASSVIDWLTADSMGRTIDASMSNGQLILVGLSIIAGIFLIGYLGARAEMKKEADRKMRSASRRKLRANKARLASR